MSEKDIIQTIVTISFLYGGSILAFIIWAIKHIIKYNLLIKEVEQIEKRLDKSEKDITAAHTRIRTFTGR